MKKRLIKKIRKTEKVAKRNIGKAIYISIIVDRNMAFKYDRSTWVGDRKGRIWLYCYKHPKGFVQFGKGYDVLQSPEKYGSK